MLAASIVLVLGCQESQNSRKDLEKEFAQNSQITAPEITPQTIKNLELLGRVWGFLKYHHPEVASGKRQWDFELFDFYPTYISATNSQERDQALLDWIEDLGPIPVCEKCDSKTKDAFIKPDHNWMEDKDISQSLRDRLVDVYNNRYQKKQHYISLKKYIRNPDFTNEEPYPNMGYNDHGYTLLSLFRYWNMVRYFYPNTYLTDTNWDDVLSKYIPVFLSTENELNYEKAILQLTAEINVTHAMLAKGVDKITEWRGVYRSSVQGIFINGKLVVKEYTNPDLQSDLKKGDIITHIDSVSIEDIVTKNTRFYAASNQASLLRKLSKKMLRSPKEEIRIDYLRNGQQQSTQLTLYLREQLELEKWRDKILSNTFRILDGNIGYIPIVSVKDTDIDIIKKQFKDTKGMIIDLRNYPGTLQMIYQFAPYLMTSTKQFMKFSQGNPKNPGEFYFGEPLKFSKNRNAYKNPVVLLINEQTQSMGEFAAMAYQAGSNTVTVGSQTAGADGDVSLIHLPGGIDTYISGIGIYYPDGRKTQRIGIVPDYEIYPSIEGIKQGRDELLEKAIELINTQ